MTITSQAITDDWTSILIESEATNQWVIYNGNLIQSPNYSTVDCQTNGKELLLIIPSGQTIREPLYLIHITDAPKQDVIHYKTQVTVENQAKATLIECYFQNEASACDTKAETEILLKKASQLQHALWMSTHSSTATGTTSATGRLITDIEIEQAETSQYRGFSSTLGYQKQFSTVQLSLMGEEAQATFHALLCPRQSEESTLHCSIQHLKPHCRSQIMARSVVDDHGKFDFKGKIRVSENAKHSSAQLENKNILLSATAQVQTCPELEIYHNDVQCNHGATIGHLDETTLFYLKSRGIPEKEAKRMIIHGFIQPILQSLDYPPLQTYLEKALHEY